jgi:hypothetical protein
MIIRLHVYQVSSDSLLPLLSAYSSSTTALWRTRAWKQLRYWFSCPHPPPPHLVLLSTTNTLCHHFDHYDSLTLWDSSNRAVVLLFLYKCVLFVLTNVSYHYTPLANHYLVGALLTWECGSDASRLVVRDYIHTYKGIM